MKTSIPAIFDHGVFRPETAVSLPEGTRVTVVVTGSETVKNDAVDPLDELDRLCEEMPIDSGGIKYTRDQLHERR
jgi:predicted DNA-binding antitoxin AbrB/MazE fold protein